LEEHSTLLPLHPDPKSFRSLQKVSFFTEAQLVALEKKKENKSIGEIETEHPGYLLSQDTYYVGNIKGRAHLSANYY
jgi:hypothetical protein